jgi:hypothetical protein
MDLDNMKDDIRRDFDAASSLAGKISALLEKSGATTFTGLLALLMVTATGTVVHDAPPEVVKEMFNSLMNTAVEKKEMVKALLGSLKGSEAMDATGKHIYH